MKYKLRSETLQDGIEAIEEVDGAEIVCVFLLNIMEFKRTLAKPVHEATCKIPDLWVSMLPMYPCGYAMFEGSTKMTTRSHMISI